MPAENSNGVGNGNGNGNTDPAGQTCVIDASSVDIPALNALVDTEYTPLVLTGAFVMFAIGLGVGKILNILAKVKP